MHQPIHCHLMQARTAPGPLRPARRVVVPLLGGGAVRCVTSVIWPCWSETRRRAGTQFSGVSSPLAALQGPGYAQWTISRTVCLYIVALGVNVLNCRGQGLSAFSVLGPIG
jgi:hypothetical protein